MELQLKAISLFSGAGGDTLGMKNAGINVVAYVEFDKDAIATHESNFPDCKLIGEDITSIPDKDFAVYTNDIDIMFGGFPCQSFSHGGKKNPSDARGFLYREFVRAVNIVRPKIIVGENVKGLLTRKMEDQTSFIDTITQEFAGLGYDIKYNLFNMKNYGIPQSRDRVLIYGIRQDLNLDMNLSNIEKLESKYNKDILEFSLANAIKIEDEEILKMIPSNKYIFDDTNTDEPFDKPPTNLNKCYNNSQLSFKTRSKSTYSAIIDKDDIARTILCSYGRMPRLFVPIKNSVGCFLRPYTVSELQQIQGFPKSYDVKGNYISQVRQIGNAIPPIFVAHVMMYIQNIMLGVIIEA